MSQDQSLRELVNARLTVAAEEIFVLFEATIAVYKEELTRSKEENQRKQQLLDSMLFPTVKLVRVGPDLPPGPDEPEEHCIKQEEMQLFTDSTVACMKREESPLRQTQTEHQAQTQREDSNSECAVKWENSSDDDKDWANPISSGECLEPEDNGDHYLLEEIPRHEFAPDENSGVTSGTDGGAKCKKMQSLKRFKAKERAQRKKYPCPFCKKSYSNLPSHIGIHTGEKPFRCSICLKAFTNSGNLFIHKRVHTKERPYSCVICRKAFTQKTNLEQHKKVHTGEKPFSCRICEKSFRWRSHLNTHMRTHSGEKPYTCTICSKTFCQKNSLDRHTRMHTGEKLFSCTVCDKAFYQKTCLDRHTRKHTGEKPFSCLVCKKTFTMKGDLNRHSRSHINKKPCSCNV